MSKYNSDDVFKAANGRWLEVLDSLSSVLGDAIDAAPKHVDCPFHGGEKDFRLFNDSHETGRAICTCGSWANGIALLMEAEKWSYSEALDEVGDLLEVELSHEPKQDFGDPDFVYKGEILEIGDAPFKNKAGNDQCRFAKVTNRKGERTFWSQSFVKTLEGFSVGNVVLLKRFPKQTGVSKKHGAFAFVPWTAELAGDKQGAPKLSSYESDAGGKPKPIPTEGTDGGKSLGKPEISDRRQKLIERQERMAARQQKRIENDRHQTAKMQELWRRCVPFDQWSLTDSLRKYFVNRGLVFKTSEVRKTDSLRFHPELEYYDEDENGNFVCKGKYPAIVCAIRDPKGELITLHRTYLTKNGKKLKVENAKKMMPVPMDKSVTGGSVRLGSPTNGVLGLAEGLETALSVFRVYPDIPCWSTVNANLMASFVPPSGVHTVIIWADLDKSRTGEDAAEILKERLEAVGIRVIICVPKVAIPPRKKGVDWNDILTTQGVYGFPRHLREILLAA